MAHFAKINTNKIVEQVIVVSNSDCNDLDFPDSELIGQNFIASLNLDGEWKQTSYNNKFRKQYGVVGASYDVEADQFVNPQPFPSWSLDENNDWQPPVPRPEGFNYWNEDSLSWLPVPVG